MIKVGDVFPEFNLKAAVSSDINTAFQEISRNQYEGKWLVVFFWPKDFNFVWKIY